MPWRLLSWHREASGATMPGRPIRNPDGVSHGAFGCGRSLQPPRHVLYLCVFVYPIPVSKLVSHTMGKDDMRPRGSLRNECAGFSRRKSSLRSRLEKRGPADLGGVSEKGLSGRGVSECMAWASLRRLFDYLGAHFS